MNINTPIKKLLPLHFCKSFLLLIIISLLFLIFPTYSISEDYEIGRFGRWDVHTKRSLIDNNVIYSYCVTQSTNIIHSNTSTRWALLFIRASKAPRPMVEIFVTFPGTIDKNSIVRAKIDNRIQEERLWASNGDRAVFYKKSAVDFLFTLINSSTLTLEVKSPRQNIIYEAVFDLRKLEQAKDCMIQTFH